MKYGDTQRKYFQLSHAQKRIWYIENMYPNTCLYNIGGTIHFKGCINFISTVNFVIYSTNI